MGAVLVRMPLNKNEKVRLNSDSWKTVGKITGVAFIRPTCRLVNNAFFCKLTMSNYLNMNVLANSLCPCMGQELFLFLRSLVLASLW